MDYPKPGSVEAIAKGCTCEPEQTNANWLMVSPKCPIHGNVEYMIWQASQKKRKR